jgi:hypothetical protein
MDPLDITQEFYNQAVHSFSSGWLVAIWQQNYHNKLLIPGLLLAEHEIVSAVQH